MKENEETLWLVQQLRGIVARYEAAELSGADVARNADSAVKTFWDKREARLRAEKAAHVT